LQSIPIYKNLAGLNELAAEQAEKAFLDCCGSTEWARSMAAARPFAMLDDLFAEARRRWFALSPSDWLEAFAAHPKIGSKKAAPTQDIRAAQWSAGEQARVAEAGEDVTAALAEANRLYEDRFGFIFIVCATGRTAAEMLAICRARYGNSVETELRLAAEEQNKITELRLGKLLEQ
jgi:OHCU decarboxylase